MGTSLLAVIEIDDNTPTDQPPFTYDCSAWDLTHDIGLYEAKDYAWYAALAGVRSERGQHPLIPPRGLPDRAHTVTLRALDPNDFGTSWLTLNEIRAAMTHAGITTKDLSDAAQRVLDAMAMIERSVGEGRVRLVFGFSH